MSVWVCGCVGVWVRASVRVRECTRVCVRARASARARARVRACECGRTWPGTMHSRSRFASRPGLSSHGWLLAPAGHGSCTMYASCRRGNAHQLVSSGATLLRLPEGNARVTVCVKGRCAKGRAKVRAGARAGGRAAAHVRTREWPAANTQGQQARPELPGCLASISSE